MHQFGFLVELFEGMDSGLEVIGSQIFINIDHNINRFIGLLTKEQLSILLLLSFSFV